MGLTDRKRRLKYSKASSLIHLQQAAPQLLHKGPQQSAARGTNDLLPPLPAGMAEGRYRAIWQHCIW